MTTLRTYARHAVASLRDVKACKVCGHDGRRWRLETHHLDGDPTNNDRANLRKLCSKCHGRMHGGMGPGRARRLCDVDGCDRVHWGRGLCQVHYMRDYRERVQGKARKTKREEPRIERESRGAPRKGCEEEGCEGKHYGKGKCQRHYMREYMARRAEKFGASGP